MTPDGREKFYHDIEQGIKPAIIDRFNEKIITLNNDESLFEYDDDVEGEGIRDKVIALLREAIETIESLVSSEGIVAVSDSVDALYYLKNGAEKDQVSTAITSLKTKISEMDHDSVRLMEAW